MSDISCNMFTSDVGSRTTDLLRQAFQQVVDDEERENQLVAYLQNDNTEPQTIHMTPEQAASYGFTFQVNEEVIYQQTPNNTVVDMELPGNIAVQNIVKSPEQDPLSSQEAITIAQINLENDEGQKNPINDSSAIKSENINFQNWHIQKLSRNEKLQKQVLEPELTLDELSLRNGKLSPQQRMMEQQNNCIQQNSTSLFNLEQRLCAIKANAHNKNDSKNNSGNKIQIELDQLIHVPSEASIFQELPVILPPSQYIIKPTQTLLKPNKKMKGLRNKLTNATTSSVNTMPSINGKINSNCIWLSGGVMSEMLPTQILKSTSIMPQVFNSNGTQFLNTPQILTGTCERSSHINNTSHSGNVINTTSVSQNRSLAPKICLSPVTKTTQPTIQRRNVQQIFRPIMKNSATVMHKPIQIINNSSNLTTIPTQFLQNSMQLPAQILKTSATSLGMKNSVTSTVSKNSTINQNSSVVLRTATVVKNSDLKTATTNSTSILKPTQISSTPISILKPQTRVTLNNTSKQILDVAALDVSNPVNTMSNLSQKVLTAQQSGTFETIKVTQNNAVKQKLNHTVNGTCLKINKKFKNVLTQPATVVTTELTDISKPLGSSENPIQIIQQGQTFHSTQRLTQTQLQQITQVLQQRNQEATVSNERVVYRVVFPEELDLRIRSPGNTLKTRGGKRGRPKKNTIRPSVLSSKTSSLADDEQEEVKDERKKVVARTRSGRLSRPPRHMVRDYKHLHHLDFLQPDLDDSDGGYSDYNTNNDKLEDEESPKELLAGLEIPKRKISKHFRCPTCNKIYLGRSRMARHFETHPDHGSPEQLPPPTPEIELKQSCGQDPLKRKGKKRGPWAYVTPEAKSERRQNKLKEAISVCEDPEIIKIASKPVLDAQSLFDLLTLKSNYDVRNFLDELKELMDKIREKTSTMLTLLNNEEKQSNDSIEINEELLCDALGINPGLYKINNEALKTIEPIPISDNYQDDIREPPLKIQKTDNAEDSKENNEERMSSGFSESSDLSISDFLNDKRNDSILNPTCPEVLSALTLMRRNPSPVNNADSNKSNNISKLLISNPQIQSQLSDNPGFQKVNINTSKVENFGKSSLHKESFIKLVDNEGLSDCTPVLCKIENRYKQSKLDHIEQAFIKLEPVDQGFIKLENGDAVEAYQKHNTENLEKIRSRLDNIETGSQSFAKGFQRLVSKIIPITSTESLNCSKIQSSVLDIGCKAIDNISVCKISDNIPMLQESVSIISNNCDGNIFETSDNLDISKMAQYDHIAHLDILNTNGVIDKNLLIDEKLVEQLHLVDQSNLVDELVSERLKNIMPDNILENNLIPNNANLDTDLDFEALSEEFNRNTSS